MSRVLVLKQIRTFLMLGLIPGLMLAWLLGSALEGILVGVTPGDWRLYLMMTLVLSVVALLAAAVPLRRAVAIDPAQRASLRVSAPIRVQGFRGSRVHGSGSGFKRSGSKFGFKGSSSAVREPLNLGTPEPEP